MKLSSLLALTTALLTLGAAAPAHAQSAGAWPNRSIRIVVPYAPGASTDTVARAVAARLSQNVGQPVIVENRAGAGGTIGSAEVVRAAPDGYTLVMGTGQTHGLVQLLTKNAPYDALKDSTPLTPAAGLPMALAVHPSIPVSTAGELLTWAKKNPDKTLSYGTPGAGSPHHLAGELLNQVAGGGIVHVPYKGSGPSIADLMANQIPMAFATLISVLPQHQAGKVKILGVVEDKRAKGAPNVPTIGESVPGYALPRTWLGFFAPPGMPPALASRVSAELVKAIQSPDVTQKLEQGGLDVMTATPEEFTAFVRNDIAVFRKILDAAGLRPE